MPAISVLVPATRPQYLGQALASVLAQSFGDYECLISDNSADGGLEPLIRSFGDSRFRYLRTGGLSMSENFSFLWNAASGGYLKFLFDDDFLFPFCLDALLAALEQHPDASFSFAHRYVVNSRGQPTRTPALIKRGRKIKLTGAELLPPQVRRIENLIGEPSNVLLRRSAFRGPKCMTRYGSYKLRFLMDFSLYVHGLQHGPCVGLGEFHSAFRVHDQQGSDSAFNPAYASALFEWDLILRGEYARGRIAAEPLLVGLRRLSALYAHHAPQHPELEPFMGLLPKFASCVEAGERNVLDDVFHSAWSAADAVIDARLAERRTVSQSAPRLD